MVLVTGPTGSGKTTTLYSALSALNTADVNISTAEDPVEFNFAGINQVQMHDDIGLNFAAALRSFLRQDPDIDHDRRDPRLRDRGDRGEGGAHRSPGALHAAHQRRPGHGQPPAEHGHRAVPGDRVAEPDPRPAAGAQALPGLQEAGEDLEEQALLDAGVPPDKIGTFTAYEQAGCRECNDRGYRGRVAIYEVMPFWDGLKELVINGASAAELKQEAIRLGMQTLRMAALEKMMGGHDHPRRGGGQHRAGPLLERHRDVANLHQLLKAMVEKGSSDLHITTGSPPQLRIDGELVPLKTAPLTPVETKQLCYSMLTDAQKHKFEEDNELDLSFGVKGALALPRQPLHAARRGGRRLPDHPLQDPHLPGAGAAAGGGRAVEEAARPGAGHRPHRLGQVTTLASHHRQDQHRASRAHHDDRGSDRVPAPAQELHRQPARGGGRHRSFKTALKYILRQDPDVVLVGEMRDLETIEAALVIAETGHVCFGTLHTNSCVQTINRVLDVFPPYQQPQIRAQLSFVLEGVLSQALLQKAGGRDGALPWRSWSPTRRSGT